MSQNLKEVRKRILAKRTANFKTLSIPGRFEEGSVAMQNEKNGE